MISCRHEAVERISHSCFDFPGFDEGEIAETLTETKECYYVGLPLNIFYNGMNSVNYLSADPVALFSAVLIE